MREKFSVVISRSGEPIFLPSTAFSLFLRILPTLLQVFFLSRSTIFAVEVYVFLIKCVEAA